MDNVPAIKLNGIRLQRKTKVKYLGIMLDEHVTWQHQINAVVSQLKRANNLIAISRHHVPPHVLQQIYYAQFHSNLTYCCQVWGQNLNMSSQIAVLQKKSVRLMTWSPKNTHSSPLYKCLSIINITDQVKLLNIIFAYHVIHHLCPRPLRSLQLVEYTHSHPTRNNPNSLASVPIGSIKCNKRSFYGDCAIDHWNDALKRMSSIYIRENRTKINEGKISSQFFLHTKSETNLKSLIKALYLNSYELGD